MKTEIFNKKLAKITQAKLSIKERGILNFWIYVDYEEGCSQGIGGICLDTYDKTTNSRIGTAYGCEMIRRLLLELNVDDFSEMKNKYIWVLGVDNGLNFEPKGIKSLNVDNIKTPNEKGLIFNDIYNQFNIKDNND